MPVNVNLVNLEAIIKGLRKPQNSLRVVELEPVFIFDASPEKYPTQRFEEKIFRWLNHPALDNLLVNCMTDGMAEYSLGAAIISQIADPENIKAYEVGKKPFTPEEIAKFNINIFHEQPSKRWLKKYYPDCWNPIVKKKMEMFYILLNADREGRPDKRKLRPMPDVERFVDQLVEFTKIIEKGINWIYDTVKFQSSIPIFLRYEYDHSVESAKGIDVNDWNGTKIFDFGPAKTQYSSLKSFFEGGRPNAPGAQPQPQVQVQKTTPAPQKTYTPPKKEEGDSKQKEFSEIKVNDPRKIIEYLNNEAIGQEQAKKVLAVAAYEHYTRIMNPHKNLKKGNVLIIGPTGSGKTYLCQRLAKILDVPFAEAKLVAKSGTGYQGRKVDEVFQRLLESARGDKQKAEQGIVYLDEFDKIAKPEFVMRGSGVSDEKIQDELIGMTGEGGEEVKLENGVVINTKDILFIGSGAFVGLEKYIAERHKRDDFGREKLYDICGPEDLMNYGFKQELIGRFPNITYTSPLTKQELVKILSHKNGAIRGIVGEFEANGVNLQVDPVCYELIAEKALEQGTGARGIDRVCLNVFRDFKVDIAKYAKEGILIVTRDMIEKKVEEYFPRVEKGDYSLGFKPNK